MCKIHLSISNTIFNALIYILWSKTNTNGAHTQNYSASGKY